jgi:Ni/Fe-hydrogenase subunit HybB-like protein
MSTLAILDEIDNTAEDPRTRPILITGQPGQGMHHVTEGICRVTEMPRPPRAWYVAFAISFLAVVVLGAMVAYLVFTGVGVWNLNRPVCWAFDITNFVFWIGIGHAGTLISAILFLFRQKWRTSINRFAEAMTIFAVMCAGLFPAIHVGRIWFVYWLFPYPNQMAVWPNFLSPLLWDMVAVSTYMTVSLLFWYQGMVPDLATLRDRAVSRWRYYFYGILSLGWRGSARHWHIYEKAYLLLAALAAPLVLSVHSVVSCDFAVAQLPGWHSTIFPPYFVAGAIFSGFAMVVTLAVPARELFGLKDFITKRHLDNMAKIIIVTSCMVGYSYLIEFFNAWYSGNPWERFQVLDRVFGPMGWCGWLMLLCNAVVPQLLWLNRVRSSVWSLFVISLLINVGMWFERFVIIVNSLHRDFLPSSWGSYWPSYVEVLTLVGSFGLFMTLFLLFCRYLPMVAMAEVKSILPSANEAAGGDSVAEASGERDSSPTEPAPIAASVAEGPAPWGLLAEYKDVAALRTAAAAVRDAGYRKWDCCTPFPVHGLDRAMGIRATVLPWLVLGAGLAGCGAAVFLQWYVNSPHTASAAAGIFSGYPLVFSGKPYWSLPAHIPIIFELTVLGAALAAFFGLWALARLPRLYYPAFNRRRFRKATDDGLLLIVEAADEKFDPVRTAELLRAAGCVAVERIEE